MFVFGVDIVCIRSGYFLCFKSRFYLFKELILFVLNGGLLFLFMFEGVDIVYFRGGFCG